MERTGGLVFENRHRKQFAAYLANSLVPNDSCIRIELQKRDSLQSHYELNYEQLPAGVRTVSMTVLLVVCWRRVACCQ
ncbi:MAG: hypothetical protein ABJB66_15690 [Gemmatimonadaceae bacterium]